MQFEGGYRYPSGRIFLLLTLLSIIIVIAIWYWQRKEFIDLLTLFLGLEGTVLLVSAFTPTGLVPPHKNLFRQVGWFLKQQGGVPVKFNQLIFYSGLVCLFLTYVLQAIFA